MFSGSDLHFPGNQQLFFRKSLIPRLLGPVDPDDDSVVPLVRFKRHLLQRLHLLRPHLLHLAGEHSLRLRGRVDAVGLESIRFEVDWQNLNSSRGGRNLWNFLFLMEGEGVEILVPIPQGGGISLRNSDPPHPCTYV